jgi:hypothetical protein
MPDESKHTSVDVEEPPAGGREEATHPGDPEAPRQHPIASGVGGLAGGAAGAAVGAAVGGPAGAVAGAVVGGAAGVAAAKTVAEEARPTEEDEQP